MRDKISKRSKRSEREAHEGQRERQDKIEERMEAGAKIEQQRGGEEDSFLHNLIVEVGVGDLKDDDQPEREGRGG